MNYTVFSEKIDLNGGSLFGVGGWEILMQLDCPVFLLGNSHKHQSPDWRSDVNDWSIMLAAGVEFRIEPGEEEE